jgi:hypothetical protein
MSLRASVGSTEAREVSSQVDALLYACHPRPINGYPDGTPVAEEEARSWAWTFFLHLTNEPGSRPPSPRARPERPTAERLDRFTQLERDWIRWTPDSDPVRMR